MRASSLVLLLVLASGLPAAAQPADATRGQLLYATHCIECHAVQMHWRTPTRVHDWESLKAQGRSAPLPIRRQYSERQRMVPGTLHSSSIASACTPRSTSITT